MKSNHGYWERKSILLFLVSILFIVLFSSISWADPCGNIKVGVIGASNTHPDYSYVSKLQAMCPESNFINKGVSGHAPWIQLGRLDTDILSLDNLDMVIMDPSGNGIGSLQKYIDSVIEMAETVKRKDSNIKVVILSNSPSKGYCYCKKSKCDAGTCSSIWTPQIQANKESFNNRLLTDKLGRPEVIDIVVDVYTPMGHSSDQDKCGYCGWDGGHWTNPGQQVMAQTIFTAVFQGSSGSPAKKIQGSGTPANPYKWENGNLGVTKSCEPYFYDGGWKKLEYRFGRAHYQNTGGDNWKERAVGNGNRGNPFKIHADVKGLICNPGSGIVDIVYWDGSSWSTDPATVKGQASAQQTPVSAPTYTPSPPSSPPAASVAPSTFARPTARSKEIDEVWKKIRGKLGLSGEPSIKVWHPGAGWIDFDELYKEREEVTPPAPTSTGLAVTPSDYDRIIAQHASSSDEAALIKAIMYAESSFKTLSISTSGCSGLMQLCATSAKEEIRVQCSQDRSVGPRQCDVDTCAVGRLKGASKVYWCDICAVGINCADDDRFDPLKNIPSGIKTFRRKSGSGQYCGIECQIAAYNIGGGVIKAAAQGQTGLSWDVLYQRITPELMAQVSSTYAGWPEEKRNNKIKHLKGYVARIMEKYREYRPRIA